MFKHVLLLCEEVERPFLTDTLRATAPALDVIHVKDAAALAAIKPEVLRESRLVGFCTPIIVPPAVLNELGFGAYNFHPGPPAYPGWMPAAFAAYDGVTEFGATAHLLSPRVDEGQIIAVDTFPVAPGASRADLARRAYLALLGVFRRIAPALATRAAPLPALDMPWGARKTTRAQFAQLADISADIGKDELIKRLRGLAGGDGYSAPTVWIHGVPFRYTPPGEGAL